MLAAGICGTDLRIAKGAHRAYPDGTRRVPGHEIAGEVVAVGAGVEATAVGERVFVAPNLGCGECPACRAGRVNLCADADAFGITLDGAFAEYMHVPAAAVAGGNLMAVPPDADPAAVSVVGAAGLRPARPARRVARRGRRVLVCGAGPIGLLHVLVARARGRGARARLASRTRASPRRRGGIGAGAVGSTRRRRTSARACWRRRTGSAPTWSSPRCRCAAVQEQALELAAVGGRINFFGGLPKDDSTDLRSTRTPSTTGSSRSPARRPTTPTDCRRALELATAGRVDLGRLVTARFGLDGRTTPSRRPAAAQRAQGRDRAVTDARPRSRRGPHSVLLRDGRRRPGLPRAVDQQDRAPPGRHGRHVRRRGRRARGDRRGRPPGLRGVPARHARAPGRARRLHDPPVSGPRGRRVLHDEGPLPPHPRARRGLLRAGGRGAARRRRGRPHGRDPDAAGHRRLRRAALGAPHRQHRIRAVRVPRRATTATQATTTAPSRRRASRSGSSSAMARPPWWSRAE